MDKEPEVKSTRRRDFLKLAGVGTLGGAAAAVSASEPAVAVAVEPTEHATGYRETAHVKKAYELARF